MPWSIRKIYSPIFPFIYHQYSIFNIQYSIFNIQYSIFNIQYFISLQLLRCLGAKFLFCFFPIFHFVLILNLQKSPEGECSHAKIIKNSFNNFFITKPKTRVLQKIIKSQATLKSNLNFLTNKKDTKNFLHVLSSL